MNPNYQSRDCHIRVNEGQMAKQQWASVKRESKPIKTRIITNHNNVKLYKTTQFQPAFGISEDTKNNLDELMERVLSPRSLDCDCLRG